MFIYRGVNIWDSGLFAIPKLELSLFGKTASEMHERQFDRFVRR